MVSLNRGDLVWGHWKKKIWWPAVVINPEDCNQDSVADNKKWLFWFGDHLINEILCKNIVQFEENYGTKWDKKNKSGRYTKAVTETLQALATQYNVKKKDPDLLFQWAKTGFKHSKCSGKNSDLPEIVRKCLAGDAFKRKDIDYSDVFEDYDYDRAKKIKRLILSVRRGSMTMNDICFCCKTRNKVVAQHPLIQAGVCSFCIENINTLKSLAIKEMKDICIVCGKRGIIIPCKNYKCHRSFCAQCLDYSIREEAYMKIAFNETWFCNVCNSNPDQYCLIKARDMVEPIVDGPPFPEKKPGVSVFAHHNGVRTILDNKKLCVKQFCTYDVKQSLISLDGEEIKYKHFCQTKFDEIAADLVCGGYFAPYESKQQGKKYMDSFIEDFYGYTFPLRYAKLANSSLFFIYVCVTEALDSMLFNRVLRFLEVRPISVKCNQQFFSVWTNIFNYRFTVNRTYSIQKKSAQETAEERIFSYFLEPLKEYFESMP